MRTLVLVAAVVLTSASAQAGGSRSLSAYPIHDSTSAVPGPSATNKSLRADNDAPAAQPAETPRYSPPPSDAAPTPPAAADTPHYTSRPAPVDNAPRATTPTTASHAPSGDDSPRGDYSSRGAHGRMMRAERSHRHRWTAGRIIATLH